jgi:thiamine-phosphate pyrophosphorylase
VREAGLSARDYVELLRECVALTKGTRCRVLVNDRVDLALAAQADGVHLREASVPIAAARRLAPPPFLIGRSVHDERTAAESRAADYMIAGSVFATASKPGQGATLGLDGLRKVAAAAGPCPVWAVGGITADDLPRLADCGARGMAAIGAFIPQGHANDVAGAVADITTVFRSRLH